MRQFFRWWYPDAFSFTHIHTLYTTIQEIWLSEWWNIFVHRPVQNRKYVVTRTADRLFSFVIALLHACIYIDKYNDEKKLLINYLRCLPVVLGTVLVRRTLQETSLHSELNLQTNVFCLSTLYIYTSAYSSHHICIFIFLNLLSHNNCFWTRNEIV